MIAQRIRIHRRKPGKDPRRCFALAFQAQQNRLPEHGVGNRSEAQRIGVEPELRIQVLAVEDKQLGGEQIVVADEKRGRALVREVFQLSFGERFVSPLRALRLPGPALEAPVV